MDMGGVQSMIMNYYRNIDRSKVQFDFVVQDQELGYFDVEIESLGGKIFRIPSLNQIFQYYKTLDAILQENKYDIIHVHQNFANVHALIVAFNNKIKNRISHSHNAFPEKRLFRKVLKLGIRILINNLATEKFACSIKAGIWLYGENAYNSGQVKIINNAIDVEKFIYSHRMRTEKRKSLEVANKIVIGHVGHFNYQKNHDFLIDIFSNIIKKNSNAHLILVGKGENLDEVISKVKELQLVDNVTFFSDRTDVNELFQAFDFFVFPSFFEGLGIVLIEAQISGLKCFISDTITDEIDITENIERLSLSKSAEHWANTILKYISSRNDRKDLSNKINSAGYNILLESKKLEQIYLKMMEVK